MALNFDLTKEEQAVISQITEGRLTAVSSRRIALRLSMAERRVRQIIRHLIDEHHCCIGSATDDPAGFYLITDPGELADVIGALRHRGISILVRARRYLSKGGSNSNLSVRRHNMIISSRTEKQ